MERKKEKKRVDVDKMGKEGEKVKKRVRNRRRRKKHIA